MRQVVILLASVVVCVVLAASTTALLRADARSRDKKLNSLNVSFDIPALLEGSSKRGGTCKEAKNGNKVQKKRKASGFTDHHHCVKGVPLTQLASAGALGLVAASVGASFTGRWLVGIIVATGTTLLAWLMFKKQKEQRRALLDEQLARVLPQIAASVRSSFTLERALRMAATRLENPLREQIVRVLRDTAYGAPLSDALEDMAVRLQSEDVKTLAAATRIRQIRGGSIASALGLIAKRMDIRLAEQREFKVEMAGTRLAKYFVAGAMPALFMMMYLSNADFARFYQSNPLGWSIAGAACVLEVVGLALAQAVTTVKTTRSKAILRKRR